MTQPLSATPPDVAPPLPGRVASRHIFYLPGYDPEAATRYRLLFVREYARHAKRTGEPKRVISAASLSGDGRIQSWTVSAGDGAAATYEILLWDDIVRRDMARWKIVSAALLVAGTLHALAAGALVRFYRMNWKYGNVIIYPFVMMVLIAVVGAAIAVFVHAHLTDWYAHSLRLPFWLSVAVAVLVVLGAIKAVEALLNRIFFWQLLNDWVFNWQHGQRWRSDYDRRLDLFTDYILARLATLEAEGRTPDEALIVGHSSGGLTAVEITARLIARSPRLGLDRPGLSLATLGSCLPLVAIQPRATRVRAEIASLVTAQRVVWVDYGAPQDWINFPGFDPSRELDLALPAGAPVANPIVRTARFRDILDPAVYLRVRHRPFRMHFQYLMANDRPGAYDFFAMTLGSERLATRALRGDAGEPVPDAGADRVS